MGAWGWDSHDGIRGLLRKSREIQAFSVLSWDFFHHVTGQQGGSRQVPSKYQHQALGLPASNHELSEPLLFIHRLLSDILLYSRKWAKTLINTLHLISVAELWGSANDMAPEWVTLQETWSDTATLVYRKQTKCHLLGIKREWENGCAYSFGLGIQCSPPIFSGEEILWRIPR